MLVAHDALLFLARPVEFRGHRAGHSYVVDRPATRHELRVPFRSPATMTRSLVRSCSFRIFATCCACCFRLALAMPRGVAYRHSSSQDSPLSGAPPHCGNGAAGGLPLLKRWLSRNIESDRFTLRSSLTSAAASQQDSPPPKSTLRILVESVIFSVPSQFASPRR